MSLDALLKHYESLATELEKEINVLSRALNDAKTMNILWRYLSQEYKQMLSPDLDEVRRLILNEDYASALLKIEETCKTIIREGLEFLLGTSVEPDVCPDYREIEVLDKLISKYQSIKDVVVNIIYSKDLVKLLGNARKLFELQERLDVLASIILEVFEKLEEYNITSRSDLAKLIASNAGMLARTKDIDDVLEDLIVHLTRLRDAVKLIDRINNEIASIHKAINECKGSVCKVILEKTIAVTNHIKDSLTHIHSIDLNVVVEETASKLYNVYESLSSMRRSLEKLAIKLSVELGIKPPQDLNQTISFLERMVSEGKLTETEINILLDVAASKQIAIQDLVSKHGYSVEDVMAAVISLCNKEVLKCSVSIG